MSEVARGGRTVLFVSHNLGAVAELCNRAILLEGGEKLVDGSVTEVLEAYSHLISGEGHSREFVVDPRLPAAILAVEVTGADGTPATTFDIADEVRITIRFQVRETTPGLQHVVTLARNLVDVVQSFDTDGLSEIPVREPGIYEAAYHLPAMFLKAGSYTARVAAGTPDELLQDVEGAVVFEVEELSANTQLRGYRRDRSGQVISPGTWQTIQVDDLEVVR
jgi:lipopolysaccharide transport system ATP-binding protein